jgi:hypothetical protein
VNVKGGEFLDKPSSCYLLKEELVVVGWECCLEWEDK